MSGGFYDGTRSALISSPSYGKNRLDALLAGVYFVFTLLDEKMDDTRLLFVELGSWLRLGVPL